MTMARGLGQSKRRRTAVTLLAVASLTLGLASVSVVLLPARDAGAATHVVTNCSGNPSVAGSLPNAVASASSGDHITFALSPTCSTIPLTSPLDVGGLTITGPGAGSLTVDGGGGTQLFSVSSGTASIAGLTIQNGSATNGGAIDNHGTLTLTDSVLTGNDASVSGGAIDNNGTLTISDSTLSSNEAGTNGGAIENTATLTVQQSTLSANTADQYGGGIESLNAGLTIENSTVAGNSATGGSGGGIDIEDDESEGTSTIENTTVWGNSADFGGGIQDDQGPLTIGATIVANSTSGNDCFLQVVTPTDLGYNLDDDGTCGFTGGTGDLSDAPSGLDPSGLHANGGPTDTIALEPGSAAIDAVADAPLCPATDQRGSNRGVPCDIGAYDTDLSPTITGLAFSGTPSSPTITVSGSGFGTESDLGSSSPAGCDWSGLIYAAPNIALSDNGWTAGESGDCIGVNIVSYNDSSIVFTLGSGYNLAGYYGPLIDGDSISMTVEGTTFNGTVSFPYQRPPYAFITDPGPNTVSQVDTTTGAPGNFFPFNPDEDADLAITPDGATAYVIAVNGDQVNPFDTATGLVGSNITVGTQTTGIAISPDGSTAYVADNGSHSVTPIDLTTDTAGTPINLEIAPDAIAITPNGSTAYVVSTEDDSVTPINLSTDAVGTAINVGNDPNAIAITPNGATAYVVDSGDNGVTPITTSTNTTGAEIPVGTGADAIAITPNGATAYVANRGDDTVTPIATSSNTAGSPITVGSQPDALAVTPSGSTVEVVNYDDNNVTPIATSSNTAGTPVAAGDDPWDIAITPDQAPVAALTVTPGNQGQATHFNASASVAPSSPITNYAWNFGDGATANTAGPTTTHVYAHDGSYTATVTETDAGGTSLTKVFTGQTMSRNGGPQARTTSTFTVGVVANDSCVVSGMSGTTSFPTEVSETTAPPSTIDAGGTFQTAYGAQVTIPASVINHFRGMGATSLTVGAQTTSENGHTTAGSPSGAVSPNSESASATNLPLSDTTLTPNTPYTYSTSYNPVTWQTGPGNGVVDFVPGTIDITVTFVISGTPTTETVTCTPPHGVGTLDSTTVNPPPPIPTFQVPASTPALQNQVTAGTDGGWGAIIANTSTVTVTGVSASVSVTDGGPALSYDLSGMAASGTNCSAAGAGKITCTIGNLPAGASDTLDVLVKTTGLATGVAITGSATVTSSNASSHTTTLGSIGVIVVQSGNSAKAVAVPGVAVVSTKKPLSKAKASITLTLPNKKIKKSVASRAQDEALAVSLAGATSTSPPPVAVTLESLAPSAEPALCPPTGSTKCEGNIIQAVGNFAAYTNKAAPIVAVLKFFYGLHIPAGTVYMLKPNGKKVDKLSACKKVGGLYNTPCVEGPETTGGSSAHDTLYAQDTVYFTGVDPAMGRR